MATFKNDFLVGTQNELRLPDRLRNLFCDNIERTPEGSKFDYKSDRYFYEPKTRNNKYATYPTTLIPYSKVLQEKIFQERQFFIFDFTDGTYYIKYNKDLFETFDLLDFQRRPRPDIVDKKQLYYYIPIEHLKKINKNPKPYREINN